MVERLVVTGEERAEGIPVLRVRSSRDRTPQLDRRVPRVDTRRETHGRLLATQVVEAGEHRALVLEVEDLGARHTPGARDSDLSDDDLGAPAARLDRERVAMSDEVTVRRDGLRGRVRHEPLLPRLPELSDEVVRTIDVPQRWSPAVDHGEVVGVDLAQPLPVARVEAARVLRDDPLGRSRLKLGTQLLKPGENALLVIRVKLLDVGEP